MSDALSLDLDTTTAQAATVRRVPSDPWLARRARRIGGSDVPAVLLAYDPRPDEIDAAPRYIAEAAALTRTTRGEMPMVIARKAGLRAPVRRSAMMGRGLAREASLLRSWARTTGTRVVLASEMPPHARQPIDHDCASIAVTLDAMAWDAIDGWAPAEAKCTRDAYSAPSWYHRAQVQTQIACALAVGAWLVVGPGWGASDDGGGEPVAWWIERDDDEIARIRRAATKAAAQLALAMEDA
jgi:hypothetical protein